MVPLATVKELLEHLMSEDGEDCYDATIMLNWIERQASEWTGLLNATQQNLVNRAQYLRAGTENLNLSDANM